jgi:hypothetical protein
MGIPLLAHFLLQYSSLPLPSSFKNDEKSSLGALASSSTHCLLSSLKNDENSSLGSLASSSIHLLLSSYFKLKTPLLAHLPPAVLIPY